jgi:EF hand
MKLLSSKFCVYLSAVSILTFQHVPLSAQLASSNAEVINGFPRDAHSVPSSRKEKRPKLIAPIDIDHSGFITRQDVNSENERRIDAFRAADVNFDGKLNSEEARHFKSLLRPKSRKRKR